MRPAGAIPVATLLGAVLALATIIDPTLNLDAYGGKHALGAGLVILWALLFPIVLRIARRVDSTRESAQSRQFLIWSVLATGSVFFAAVALAWLVNELSGLGIPLSAGQLVTTGTCLVPLEIAPGDRMTADFGVLGVVDVCIGR